MQGLDAYFATQLNRHQTAIDAQDDGHKCQNSEPSNYGHECGDPAQWQGEDMDGYRATFCDHCRRHGNDARLFHTWTQL